MAKISFNIADAKLADFKAGFLRARPIPKGTAGTPQAGQPLYTEDDWIQKSVKAWAIEQYRSGKFQLAQDTVVPSIDEGM